MIDEMYGDFLQKLRGFYWVAKTGSVSLAAIEMGRNQPTISHQVKSLENQLGAQLFDRSKERMELTPEGTIVLDKAILIFELVRGMKDELLAKFSQLTGKIGIATSPAIAFLFLPKFVADFRNKHPEVTFEIEALTLGEVLDKVISSEADFGIASPNYLPESLVFFELFQTKLVLVSSRKTPRFKEKDLTLEEISKAPFVFYTRASTLTGLVTEKFTAIGLPLNIVVKVNNYEILKKLIDLGLGVSILYDFMITGKEVEEKFDVFPLDQFFGERKFGLLFRRTRYVSPSVRAFVRAIKPDMQMK